jgi:hypothetical protein
LHGSVGVNGQGGGLRRDAGQLARMGNVILNNTPDNCSNC